MTKCDKYGIFTSDNMTNKIHHPTRPGTSEKMRSRRNRLRDVTELDAIPQLIGVILACDKKNNKTNEKARQKSMTTENSEDSENRKVASFLNNHKNHGAGISAKMLRMQPGRCDFP